MVPVEDQTMTDPDDEADSQDMAEIFDETHTTGDTGDIAHPDIAPDEYDVTRAEDDGDEDQPEALDDFDPDAVDEAELELMLEEDDGVDGNGRETPDPSDAVSAEDPSPEDFEFEAPATDGDGDGDRDAGLTRSRKAAEARLDADLEASFPASDPPSISPGST
jgi:hypothetical protein